MDKNEISLRIICKNGDEPLSPANFDIGQIRFLLDEVENLLYPDRKKRIDRPTISYELKEGSVLNVFKTSMQSVLLVSSMLGVIEQENGCIDKLEVASAQAIENLQFFALRHNYDIEIGTSDKPNRIFKITPKTHYVRRENILVDIECYYYGTLTDAGGKDKANIHLDTKDAGSLTIRTDKEYLAGYQGNPLYKKFGVRVRAKKNILTGDIDKSTLVLVELTVMLNSVYAAQHPHHFVYRGYEVETTGNPLTHVVLRGAVSKHGNSTQNYHYEDLIRLCDMYAKMDLVNPAAMIDANHSNSGKQFKEQIRIVKEVMHNRQLSQDIHNMVKGVMIESYIEEGSQKIHDHIYGKSITDPCLGWEDSKKLIYDIAEMCK